MNNESFVFYKSFFEAIEMIPRENQLDIYKALCSYSFNGELPNGISGTAKALFILMKPNIDSANQRYRASVENGKKGGAPKGNQNASKKKQSRNNPKQPKNNLNDNVDVNYNDDLDVNYNDNEELHNNSPKTELLNKIEIQFKQFWECYPKKRNKETAYKYFIKLKPSDELFNEIMDKLELFKQTKEWQKENGQYIPYPSTWLNQKRWQDEITEINSIETKVNYLKEAEKIGW